jgi:hypothetical protein
LENVSRLRRSAAGAIQFISDEKVHIVQKNAAIKPQHAFGIRLFAYDFQLNPVVNAAILGGANLPSR